MSIERERDNQSWVYDLMVKMTGRTHNFAYDHRELPPEVKNYAMIPRVMEKRARNVENIARAAEAAGHRATAAARDQRAIPPYHVAQHAIYRDDDQEKIYLHGKLQEVFAGVVRNIDHRVETVEIPFDGATVQGYFHLAPGDGPKPAVLYCPGMDQTTEQFPNPLANDFAARGMHMLTIDGPGQGISNIRKLRLTADNYERAGQAAVDWLLSRPEVDTGKLAVFGGGLACHWVVQIAGVERRLAAAASAFAAYTSKRRFFDIDSPRYKRIAMYMTGLHDEGEFDAFADAYTLEDRFPRIQCPMLMVNGEFDPMSDVAEALDLYRKIPAAREFWILENDFHMPMGRDNFGGLDVYPFIADWIKATMDHPPAPGASREVLIRQNGGIGPYAAQMVDYRLPGRLKTS